MSIKTMTTAIAATTTALLLAASAASAAQATGSVNVRSGPGTNFRVVDQLSRGETVNVGECRSNGFCYITHPGPDGWVSSRYLTNDRRGQPSVSFSFSFGNGRPGNDGRPSNNEEQVCLVTFFERSQVEAGADADVQSARVLPRSEAERRDGPNDRRRIFDYGSNRQTRETCDYLASLN